MVIQLRHWLVQYFSSGEFLLAASLGRMEKIKATRRGFFAALFAVIAARFAPKPKKLSISGLGPAEWEEFKRQWDQERTRRMRFNPGRLPA